MKDKQTTMLRMRRLGRKVPGLRMVGFSVLVWARSRSSNSTSRCGIGESLVQPTPTFVPVQPARDAQGSYQSVFRNAMRARLSSAGRRSPNS